MIEKFAYTDWNEVRRRLASFLMALAMMICAGVSAYATYLGLELQSGKNFALLLALASLLVMLLAAYFAGRVIYKEYHAMLKSVIVAAVLVGVFSFSTLWSIVGMAKHEVFRLDSADSINSFVTNYSATGYVQQYESSIAAINQVEVSIRAAAKNSENGVYTGKSGRGTITKSMILVADKLAKAAAFQEAALKKVEQFDHIIKTNLSEVQDHLETLDKKTFSKRVSAINAALSSLKNIDGTTTLSESMVALDSVINALQQLKALEEEKGRNRQLLNAEILSLEANRKRIQKLINAIQVTTPSLRFSPVTEPPIIQCFRHFSKTFHWWALSIALDIVPFWLMISLIQRGRRNRSVF